MKINRLQVAAALAVLVWLADQPTVQGYNPLVQMLWNPGVLHLPAWDLMVLFCSWLLTTFFCHFALFTMQRARQRH
jgi:antibiotic biosynthesis monooxygenase (ABM) superfamily enzyme